MLVFVEVLEEGTLCDCNVLSDWSCGLSSGFENEYELAAAASSGMGDLVQHNYFNKFTNLASQNIEIRSIFVEFLENLCFCSNGLLMGFLGVSVSMGETKRPVAWSSSTVG